jgi:hypothetical protein
MTQPTFDKTLRSEGTLVLVQRTTWGPRKARTTFRKSEDGGQTFKAIPAVEAHFLLAPNPTTGDTQ